MTNCTLSGNSGGSGNGGGIYNHGGMVTLTNSTLTGNSASQGGGIYTATGGTTTLTNTIVAANTATPANGPDLFATVMSGGHNLIGATSGSMGITGGMMGDIVTPTPLLGMLSNSGGPTQTIPLLAGSPAIGAGDIMVCARTTGAAPVAGKDQRGIARQAAVCSIGAFEAQAAVPHPTATPPMGATPNPQPTRH